MIASKERLSLSLFWRQFRYPVDPIVNGLYKARQLINILYKLLYKFCTNNYSHFLSCLFLIIFLNASTNVVAYFDFKGSTRR